MLTFWNSISVILTIWLNLFQFCREQVSEVRVSDCDITEIEYRYFMTSKMRPRLKANETKRVISIKSSLYFKLIVLLILFEYYNNFLALESHVRWLFLSFSFIQITDFAQYPCSNHIFYLRINCSGVYTNFSVCISLLSLFQHFCLIFSLLTSPFHLFYWNSTIFLKLKLLFACHVLQ